MLLFVYEDRADNITLRLDLEPLPVSIDFAVPFGLLLHELFSNALKHAFPTGSNGEIRIALHSSEDGGIDLRVSDTGIGLPEHVDFRHPASVGFRIVTLIAEQQLQGTVALNRKGHGTELHIRFKKPRFEHRI